jgi:hypothetical protein
MSEAFDTDDEVVPKVVQHQMSMPSQHTDPFAPREGKTLVWKDINMTLVRNGTSVSSAEESIGLTFCRYTKPCESDFSFDAGWPRR